MRFVVGPFAYRHSKATGNYRLRQSPRTGSKRPEEETWLRLDVAYVVPIVGITRWENGRKPQNDRHCDATVLPAAQQNKARLPAKRRLNGLHLLSTQAL